MYFPLSTRYIRRNHKHYFQFQRILGPTTLYFVFEIIGRGQTDSGDMTSSLFCNIAKFAEGNCY